MKNIFIYLFLPIVLLVSCSSPKDEKGRKYDTRAIKNLDLLSEKIGGLKSCSYTLYTIKSDKNGLIHSHQYDTYLSGANHAHLHSGGKKGQRSFWFDGQNFSYLSYDKNTFDTVAVSGTTLDAIEFVNEEYGIDFPAADFFYPTFTDDLLNHYDHVLLIDGEKIDGVNSIGIEASNSEELVHIWIEKATNLPGKLIIESKESKEYYEATFSNWRLNPNLPDALFKFTPPAKASRIKLSSKF